MREEEQAWAEMGEKEREAAGEGDAGGEGDGVDAIKRAVVEGDRGAQPDFDDGCTNGDAWQEPVYGIPCTDPDSDSEGCSDEDGGDTETADIIKSAAAAKQLVYFGFKASTRRARGRD